MEGLGQKDDLHHSDRMAAAGAARRFVIPIGSGGTTLHVRTGADVAEAMGHADPAVAKAAFDGRSSEH